jgi:hypothetical protein
LPDALPLTGPGIDDALGVLYAAMSQQGQSSLQIGDARVKSNEDAQKRAIAQEQAAQARERANEANHGNGFFGSIGHLISDVTNDAVHLRPDHAVKDTVNDVVEAGKSPAFWHDIEQGALWTAKVAAVVGSVATTIATGGAAGATIAGAALLLSIGGEAVAQTKCFGKDSGAIGLGMEIGGAVAGLGTTLLPAASVADEGVQALAVASNGVSAGATGVEGAAHIRNAEFAAAAQSASADATEAAHHDTEMTQLTTWLIDDMKADDKSRQRGMQATRDAIQGSDQAHAAAAAGVAPVTLKG